MKYILLSLFAMTLCSCETAVLCRIGKHDSPGMIQYIDEGKQVSL